MNLTDAYLHVLIHPSSRKCLRFSLKDSIQSSTIWSVNEPICVHSSHESNSISSSQKSYHSLSLPRRLVIKKPKPSNSFGTQTIHHSIDCKSGTDIHSIEVRPDSISEIHFASQKFIFQTPPHMRRSLYNVSSKQARNTLHSNQFHLQIYR